MSAHRDAHAARRPAAARRTHRRARTRGLTGGAGVIRWDRVSRIALLLVLLVLMLLYVGPLRSYWSTLQEARSRRAEVAELKRENRRLRERRAALQTKSALEREARRLGMVRPGERPFVVSGLPDGR